MVNGFQLIRLLEVSFLIYKRVRVVAKYKVFFVILFVLF